MTDKKILVTGGTGFLGGAIVKQLLAKRYKVRVMTRSPESASFPDDVEIIRGDMERPASLDAALEGCDTVIHTASLVKMWARDKMLFDRVNVEGLAHLIRLSKKHAIRKMVYTSSFMALAPSSCGNGEPLDESSPYPPSYRPANNYERTKYLGDVIARQAAKDHFPIVIVYPGVIYGPGRMTDGNLVGHLIRMHLTGKLPGIFGHGATIWSYAFVEDVAEGHILALEKAPVGSRCVLGGDNRSLWEMFTLLRAITGRRRPLRIPFGIAKAVGFFKWGKAEITGREPDLTHQVVEIFKHNWALSSKKARQELGFRVTPLEEGLYRTLLWLKEELHLDIPIKAISSKEGNPV